MRRPSPVLLAALTAAVAISCSSATGRTGAGTIGSTARTTTTATVVTRPPVPASGCTPARAHPAGQFKVTIPYAGTDRDYLMYVPAVYTGGDLVPVLFDFHGYGSSAASQLFYSEFRPLSDLYDFLIVAPDGQGSGPNRHFNVTGERGLADDVGFALAVLDQVQAAFCVDARRVYSAGMSNGGAMTSALACRASDRFAAFGTVAIVTYAAGCAPGRSVSIAAFNGTEDPIAPFYGGRLDCCGHPPIGAAPTAMAGWAAHDGCAASPTETRLSSMVLLRRWSGCTSGSDVRFYIIEGGGHTWPGTYTVPYVGATTDQISAANTLWAFFRTRALPG